MTETAGQEVLVETAGAVATLTLNRPEAMNSLDLATKRALLEAVQSVGADERIRAVVLTAGGRGFCVGQDLREFVAQRTPTAAGTPSSAQVFATVVEHYAPISLALATMPKPVVAAVNGAAAGAGFSLALAADFRIAAEKASFTPAFGAIGLSPDTGMSWYLPRIVGAAKAAEILLLGTTLTAADALALGLVTSVVPADDLAKAAAELAARLAEGPTVAYAHVRQLLAYGATHSLADTLRLEHELIVAAGATSDHADSVEAFLAKRKPEFRGR
jgi:2-(1,2-epoxy-1,2-dihydrophenyl)acetyl-CoA isomerase